MKKLFRYACLIALLYVFLFISTGCSQVLEVNVEKTLPNKVMLFPTPTPTYANKEGEIDFEIESEQQGEDISYFSSDNNKQITYFVLTAHNGPVYYKVVFQKWPRPSDLSVSTDGDHIIVNYQQNDNENAAEENYMVSFKYEKEIYLDGLILKINGDKYDNKNIKQVFGME